MAFLLSIKDGNMCVLNGHIYTKVRKGKTKIFWKCRMKHSTGCEATLTTDLQQKNPIYSDHNHEPNYLTDVELIRTRNRVKQKASETNKKTVQIYFTVWQLVKLQYVTGPYAGGGRLASHHLENFSPFWEGSPQDWVSHPPQFFLQHTQKIFAFATLEVVFK